MATALFSFDNLSANEVYRTNFGVDPDFIGGDRTRRDFGCVVSWIAPS
jgi:hypothetical protein